MHSRPELEGVGGAAGRGRRPDWWSWRGLRRAQLRLGYFLRELSRIPARLSGLRRPAVTGGAGRMQHSVPILVQDSPATVAEAADPKAAAIDRIVHHSVILEFDVTSYRTNAAQNRRTEEESDWQE